VGTQTERASGYELFRPAATAMIENVQDRLQNANQLLARGHFDVAIEAYDEFLAAYPGSGEAWHNRGIALAETKRFALAAQSFGRAVELRPDSAASWHNRGMSLAELGEFEQAARDHSQALAIQPDMPDARGNLVLARLNCCDWQGLEEQRRRIADSLAQGKPAIVPFGNLFISGSPVDQLRCAQLWMARHAVHQAPVWRGNYDHERLRVAYVSGDFRSHPVAGSILPLLQNHDRGKFECFGISYGPDDSSEMRRRIVAGCEHFIDVRGGSDDEIAALLRRREIDIAIDLMGITWGCRPGIFATRCAPLQVCYLGFPASTGADFIDYLIADQIVIPESEQVFFSEKIAYLPRCYLPGGYDTEILGAAPSCSAAGLPENAFVFCCFNANYKILPKTFASWMAILRAVEGSVLWLSEPNVAAKENLRREAADRGVSPARVIFAPHVPSYSEHLARVALAGLFLDTAPFNAHVTAIDAISAGVPVLTLAGTSMSGRAGQSLLTALHLTELIARSVEEYQRTAIRLAREREKLAAIRDKMIRNRAALLDARAFAWDFERTLLQMHDRHRSGLPPEASPA
jgi:protein O-GlcNAc transferase